MGDLGVILFRPMMIASTGSGRVNVHNDLFMVSVYFLQPFSQLFMKQELMRGISNGVRMYKT